LDCALELFFACPDELSAFAQSSSSSSPERSDVPTYQQSSSAIPRLSVPRSDEAGLATPQPCERGPAAPESVQIENRNSKLENHPDPDEVAFARLASLTAAQYDRVRKREAIRLRIRIETLDAE